MGQKASKPVAQGDASKPQQDSAPASNPQPAAITRPGSKDESRDRVLPKPVERPIAAIPGVKAQLNKDALGLTSAASERRPDEKSKAGLPSGLQVKETPKTSAEISKPSVLQRTPATSVQKQPVPIQQTNAPLPRSQPASSSAVSKPISQQPATQQAQSLTPAKQVQPSPSKQSTPQQPVQKLALQKGSTQKVPPAKQTVQQKQRQTPPVKQTFQHKQPQPPVPKQQQIPQQKLQQLQASLPKQPPSGEQKPPSQVFQAHTADAPRQHNTQPQHTAKLSNQDSASVKQTPHPPDQSKASKPPKKKKQKQAKPAPPSIAPNPNASKGQRKPIPAPHDEPAIPSGGGPLRSRMSSPPKLVVTGATPASQAASAASGSTGPVNAKVGEKRRLPEEGIPTNSTTAVTSTGSPPDRQHKIVRRDGDVDTASAKEGAAGKAITAPPVAEEKEEGEISDEEMDQAPVPSLPSASRTSLLDRIGDSVYAAPSGPSAPFAGSLSARMNPALMSRIDTRGPAHGQSAGFHSAPYPVRLPPRAMKAVVQSEVRPSNVVSAPTASSSKQQTNGVVSMKEVEQPRKKGVIGRSGNQTTVNGVAIPAPKGQGEGQLDEAGQRELIEIIVELHVERCMASAKVMIHPPPRTALPPPPSYEEDDEDAFDYEQYSRTDNEDDGEEEMYSAQGSPFKGHERTRSRSIATANPFHVFDPPESTRFASPAPELSFVTTSTAESSARSVRGSGSGSGSVIGAAEGVMIRQASDYTPSPVDVIPADKSGIWDEVGRNRQRSGNRTSLSASGSGSGSASGSGASTPGYGLAPALPTGTVSSSATHLSRAHYSPLAMQRPSLTLRTSSYGHPSSTDDFANSPLSREISQLRIGSEGVQGRARSGTVSSRTSLSSMARPVEDVASQSDASRRNSLHRSVLDRNSIQQFELGAGCISRSTTALTADKWLESSDYDSDLDGVLSRNRAVGNQTPATEWNHRYYGETSFQSETELEGNAVGLVEDGKSRIIDAERMTSWGGVTRVTERLRNESEGQFDGGIIEEFDGATHLLLSHVGLGEQVIDLLSVLLPVVASTLVVLDISNNLLLDLPPSLARCHSLEELNISENPVLVLPSWAGELINLRMVMADGCGLKTLPAELAKARMLHTICVRRNRMINLPSWLSQLCKLETLLIDDNPFAGYWQQMIGNILVQPLESIPPVPPVPSQFRRPSGASSPSLLSPVDSPYPPSSNPSLASIHSPRLHSLASPGLVHSPYHDASRHASEVTLSPSTTQPQSANSSGYFDSASAGPSRVASPPLPAIPDSARPKYPGLQPSRPAGQIKVPTRKPSRALKRMRSAGALLGLRMEEGYQHGAMSAGEMETLVSEPERYPRQGQPIPIQHDMSSDDEGPQRTVSDRPPTKTGKWGFLKKMSMSKMRAPAITRNPPSDPAKLQKHPVRIPKSASTMPTMRRLPEGGSVSEFGVNLPRETPSPALSATMPVKGSRTKRRSFLPILDAPPSLDIPIPTVSGFDASLAFANSPTIAQRMVEDASKSPLPERNNQESHGRSYDIGLKSIMSYLRDLYDLSLPIPVINAGAEIVHSDASGASGSVSATSEPRVGSPLASGRVLPTVGFRSRRPTIVANDMDDVAGDRSPVSITEINDQLQIARPNSVARQAPEEPVHQKKYKDDSGVRTGVIRHILDTERSYVQGLRELVDIYVRPASLLVKGSIETVIPQTERKIVFGGIEGILRFHEVSFLPTLETAAKDLLRAGDDATGERSKRVARALGEAFQTYHPFMRQYSTYINNFDFALSRLASWATIHDKFTSGTAAGGVGLGISTSEANNSQLTPAQRKRVKHFLKACRKNPKHTQINLESYLLLPVQRIPRYRMLLDSLARSTPPSIDVSLDPIEAALEEMVALASTMNEEKRDAESRQRLVKWQSRIRGRFASPLVQAHRRLLLDGSLLLTRIVKRSSTFVEVSSSLVDDNGNNENTITNAKTIVQIEALAPEVPNRQLAAIVTSDLMILCKDPAMGKDPNSQLDLYAVLKMQTKRKPAMLLQGSGIRLVDNKAILYLSASSHQEAANWVRIINNEFDPLR